jgi:hypothetical protein
LTTSRSRAHSVSLGLPPGWVDRSVLTYVGPDDGDGSPSLVVTTDEVDGGTTLARYAAMQDAAVRAGFEGIDLLEDRETTVSGHAAVRRTYRWRYDDRIMRQRMWCLLVGEVGYAIIASAPDAAFDGLRSTFAAALHDFRVRAPD